MRRCGLRRALLLSAALLAIAAPALAQVEQIERKGPGVVVPPPETSTDQVDLTGVWYHLHHRDRAAARLELQRLQEEHPGWEPPVEMVLALNGKPAPAALAHNAKQPAQASPIRPVDAAEAAIYDNHIDAKGLEALAGDMRRHRDAADAEKIGRALLIRNRPDLARGWMERALAWSRAGSAVHEAAARGLAQVAESTTHIEAVQAEAAARTAAASGDWSLAEQQAGRAEAAGPSRIRTDLGWAALDAKDPARAEIYFAAGPQNEESRYGRVLALSRSDADLDRIASFCTPVDRTDRIAEVCGDAFAARAVAAYRAEQWDQVIALDARTRDLGLVRPGTTVLTGWSLFRKGEYEAALRRFDEASADPAAAEGIAQSLMAMNRYDELEQRANTMTALAEPYRRQVGDLAQLRQRSALGASVGAPGTAGIEAPSVSAGFYDRSKSGGVGADRIDEQGLALSLRTAVGRDVFSTGLETAWGHNGVSADNAALASPWVKWERQAVDSDLSATLGSSPIGGAVTALPAVAISAEKDWADIIGTAGFKVAPRYDSLTSMAGQRDQTTGAAWGRVVEIGPQLSGILLAGKDFAVTAGVGYGTLQGHDVAGNDHLSATLSGSYSLTPGGFDYLRVGPFYSFDAYGRNEFFFTPGNGGYYSPQASHALGLFADILTEQGKSWLVGGRIGESWQYARQGDEAQHPLADDGSRFSGVTQTELGTDATVRGAVLLGRGLILGAFGRVTISPSDRDKAAGLTLTVPLSGRDGVFSDDLPHFIDRAWP
jgi:hypothetical protein